MAKRSTRLDQRNRFFDKQVHMQAWKDSMAGQNEEKIIEILADLGYELGIDYVRQHPISSLYVIDFAFLKEQVALEVDGIGHRPAKSRKQDDRRDFVLRHKGWVTIRIPEWKYDKNPSFYKALIKEVVTQRRQEYENYKLELDESNN